MRATSNFFDVKLVALGYGKLEYCDFDADSILICGASRFFWRGNGVTREYLLPPSILDYEVIDLFVNVADQLLEE